MPWQCHGHGEELDQERLRRNSAKNDSMSSLLTTLPDSARAWSMTLSLSLCVS